MNKVYLVSDGSYSDYHVLGIYTTLEKAEQARKLYAAENEIEEVELDMILDAPPGMLRFRVDMDRYGTTARVVHVSIEAYPPSWGWVPYSIGGTHVSFAVWARDKEHAVKIANEKRTGLLLSGEWTTDWKEWQARQKR